MKVQEIIDLAYSQYGSKYQVSPEQILNFINIVQELAFNRDLNQFLVWDIPFLIVDGQLSYDFPAPSDLDTFPDVRKILGVTAKTEKQILNDLYNYKAQASSGDYGFIPMDEGSTTGIFVAGRIDNIRRRFTFANTPSLNLTNPYRWIYYIKPKPIRNSTDDERLILPSTWHYQVIYNGVVALMDSATYGGKTYEQLLRPILEPFWNDLTTGEIGLNGVLTEAT